MDRKAFYSRQLNRIKGRICRGIKGNKGTTMLEVLIAFTVLMIVLGVIYKMISFSSELRMEAADIRNAQTEFEAELYKSTPDDTKVTVYPYRVESQTQAGSTVSYPVFVLNLNTEKTDVIANFGVEEAALKHKQLNLMRIVADSFASKNTALKVIPKALKFIYLEN